MNLRKAHADLARGNTAFAVELYEAILFLDPDYPEAKAFLETPQAKAYLAKRRAYAHGDKHAFDEGDKK